MCLENIPRKMNKSCFFDNTEKRVPKFLFLYASLPLLVKKDYISRAAEFSSIECGVRGLQTPSAALAL